MNAWLEHEADGLPAPPDCCACSEDHAAFAAAGSIYLLQLSRFAAPPTILQPSLGGPGSSISSLCLARARLGTSSSHATIHQLLLIAATPRSLCIWSVPDVQAAAEAADRPPAPLRLGAAAAAGGGQGAAAGALAVEPSSSCLAVGRGWDVETWSLSTLQQDLRLTGHEGAVSALCFDPSQPWRLVSAGEDRMFMVWDLHQGACLFQSHILSSAPITTLAFDPAGPRLTTGQTDGTLRFFDLSSLPRCPEEHAVDISKELTKAATATAAAAAAAAAAGGVVPISGGGQQLGGAGSAGQVRVVGTVRQQVHQLASASGRWDGPGRSPDVPCFDAQASSSSILTLLHLEAPTAATPAPAEGDNSSPHGLRSVIASGKRQQLLPHPQLLLVATPHAVLLLNAASYAVLRVLWLGQVAEDMAQQAAGASGLPSQLLPATPTAACCAAALQGASQQVTAVVGALVSCEVAFIGMALEASAAAAGTVQVAGGLLNSSHQQQGGWSVYQEQPLPPGSPLLQPGTGTSSTSGSSGSGPVATTSGGGVRGIADGARAGGAGSQTAATVGRSRWGASSSTGADADIGSSKDASKSRSSTTSSSSSSRSPQVVPQSTPVPRSGTTSSSTTSSSKSKPPPAVNKVKPGRQLTDQPVTFHRKVKSSGYGFVQPKVQLGCSKPAPVKVSLQPPVQQQLARHLAAGRTYPLEADPPCALDASLGLPGGERVHSAAVMGLAYSGDGSRLLTGSADHSARALMLPLARHKGSGTDFRGHNAPIAAASWSLDGSRCLTAGMDRSACLWGVGRVTPLLRFTHLHQPPRAAALPAAPSGISSTTPGRPLRQAPALSTPSRRTSSSSSAAARSKPPGRSSAASMAAASSSASPTSGSSSSSSSGASAGKELGDVTAAKFFRMDELVVLGAGNQLVLYRYDISSASEDADDITRLRTANLSTYTLAGSWASSAQALLDVSVVNGFLSTLAVAAGSNRALEVVDTAVCQVVATMPEAHTRPVYRLVQPQPSPWVDPGRDAYQLCASLAQDGTCRLWDLRCCQAVRTLTGIGNSQLRTGATFSPCMRYFAAGSQEQCVLLWDLRSSGGLLQRTRVAGSQGVADVAWHPLLPQLALGCMDGSVHFCSSGDAGVLATVSSRGAGHPMRLKPPACSEWLADISMEGSP